MPYDKIRLIVNALSARFDQEQLNAMAGLLRSFYGVSAVEIHYTERKRHAVELAFQACLEHPGVLIIALGGDGTYFEVVNGAMRAKCLNPEITPVTVVWKSGNANDHFKSLYGKLDVYNFACWIYQQRIAPLTVLRLGLTGPEAEGPWYASSYIGVGPTAIAAELLNQGNYGFWGEKLRMPIDTLRAHQPVLVEQAGQCRWVDNLSFHQTERMAKFLHFKDARPTRPAFQVLEFPAGRFMSRLRVPLAMRALSGTRVAGGYTGLPEASQYSFGLPEGGLIQLDGEVIEPILPGYQVSVKALSGALRTIVPSL